MASVQKVQAYVAYWFQLGKPIVLQHQNAHCLPAPVFQGSDFSLAFLDCWQQILADPSQSFLQGTDESIAALLSDEWDIEGCARCTMPLPMPVRGIKVSPCPCADLPSWPDETMPTPRPAVCSHTHLGNLRNRLDQTAEGDSSDERDRLQLAFAHSPGLKSVAQRLGDAATTACDRTNDSTDTSAPESLKKPSEPSALDG